MASTLADLSPERRSELATYLARFSPGNPGDEHEPLQYWELVAERLRSDYPNKFSGYTEARLAAMNERILLEDLSRRAFPLAKFKTVLEVINCQPALNVFQDAIPPIIRRQPPNNIDVKEGSPIVLKVEAECHPGQPKYQWFKERNPIVGQDKHTLLIKNAAIANSGNYICRVTNTYINDQQRASVFSRYATVTVVGKREVPSSNPRILQEVGDNHDPQQVSTPKILRHPSSTTTVLNSRVELTCEAEGATVYDWYKNDVFLKSTGAIGKLVFEKAICSNSGMYHCVAIGSKGGRASSQLAKLTVEMGITVTKEPQDLEVRVSEEFYLTCEATNQHNKKMNYMWFQRSANGREVFRGKGQRFVGHVGARRDVELKFFCRVSVEDNPDLCVISRTSRIKVKTVWITEQPKGIKGVIGSSALLHCKAEGLGDISYMWFKLETKNGNPKPIPDATNEWYVINHLGQKHWGYYFCQAGNCYENAESRKVHVSAHPPTAAIIARRTKSMQPPPLIKIVKQPWSQVIPLGGHFRLLCEAVSSGDEPLSYQWHFCGAPIPGETKHKLVRENIDQNAYGSYWCFINTSSNNSPAISNIARIEQSNGAPSPGLSPRSGNFEAEVELMTKKKERFARQKVALLIGNQRYDAERLNDLKTPEGDIKELHRDLKDLDFKVISLVNLRHSEIMKALEEFYKMLAVPGIYALFYYSGHGFQTPEKRSYLIPVDATLPLRLDYNIYVDGVIGQMQQKLSRAFVILDCCRSVVKDYIPDDHHHSLGSLDSLPQGLASMSNYVEISSCVDNFTADDFQGTRGAAGSLSPTTGSPKSPNSFFNEAFREALKIKGKNMSDIFQSTLKKFTDPQSGIEQRPHFRGGFADGRITLHDVVMMDDPQEQEHLLNKVLTTYEQAHAVPDPILLEGEKKLGKLAGLARLEVEFRNVFSNVLHITTKLVLLQKDKTTTVNIKYDREFIGRQFERHEDVIIEQGPCFMESASCQAEEEEEEDEGEEEGGQEEYESSFVTTLRVFNIQRLTSEQKPKLKLFLTATVGTEGTDKVANVSYEVPLTTHLLNKKD